MMLLVADTSGEEVALVGGKKGVTVMMMILRRKMRRLFRWCGLFMVDTSFRLHRCDD